MSSEASAVSNAGVDVPQIVVTEPSPMIENPPLTSLPVSEKEAPTQDEYTEPRTSQGQTEADSSVPGHTSSVGEQERDSSSEFSPAEDCIECAVPVPEAVSEQVDTATESSSVTDPDEFRQHGCCHINVDFAGHYTYIWNFLESRYSIPLWLLALSLPVSAGIMGALYMFSCPASDNLPNMVFMIGVSLMAVLTLRVCTIIHRLTWEDSSSLLRTMNVICLLIASFFFVTEATTFWQMNHSIRADERNYCHPTFSTYTFWWNIATSVLMVILIMFPIC